MQHLKNFREFLNESEHQDKDIYTIINNDDIQLFLPLSEESERKLSNELWSDIFGIKDVTSEDSDWNPIQSIVSGNIRLIGNVKHEYEVLNKKISVVEINICNKEFQGHLEPNLPFGKYIINASYFFTTIKDYTDPHGFDYNYFNKKNLTKFLNDFKLVNVIKPPKEVSDLNWVKKNVEVENYEKYPWLSIEDKEKLKSRIIKHKFDL